MAKKLYYKIGEACKILEIQPYVLRYWETEFPFLSPNKSKSGQRVYSDYEIGIIRRIKELLYEEGYTIAGAKKKLEGELASDGADEPEEKAKTPKRSAGKKPPAKRRASSQEAKAGDDARLEEMRAGVEVALRQAREILDVLHSD